MKKYKIVSINSPNKGIEYIGYYSETRRLMSKYGLYDYFSLNESKNIWEDFSAKNYLEWMIPTKESVEMAFGVKLEEV